MGIPISPPWFMTMLTAQLAVFRPDVLNSTTSQFPDTRPSDLLESYDFIVVGAGTGGSIVANRLSEVSDWNILVLEAGQDEGISTEVPILARDAWFTRHDWNYTTKKQERACLATDGTCYIPRGRSLGGTSAINHMMYVRGNRYDYDNWQALDVMGWAYDKVLPYFLKSENMEINDLEDSKFHGKEGPVSIQYPEYATPLREAYIKAGEELGYKTGDYNAEKQTGIFYPQFTMKDGFRVSTAKAYLRPIKDRKNVHVVQNALVTKIYFDNDTSVEYVEFQVEDQVFKVKVDKEIVLAAGVFNSAKILMLSGIGPKEHLNELKIPVIVDSTVGDNLQDQVSVPVHFRVKEGAALTRPMFENKAAVELYAKELKGPLTSVVGFEGVGFFSLGEKINDTLPDIQTVMMSYIPMPGDAPVIIFSSNKLRPLSRGEMRLKSSDPTEPPIIDPKYLSNDKDYEDTINACLHSLKLSKTKALEPFTLEVDTTWTPKCSSYKNENELCKCLTENYSHPMYTAGGTAKMAHPKEAAKSVVCPLLRVHGVHGLRVADTSAMPLLTSGDTHAPSLLIAEMGADFIKQQWI